MLMENASRLSIVVPVGSRHDPLAQLHAEYEAAVAALGHPYEFIYVIDGAHEQAAQALAEVERSSHVSVARLARSFGEATALMTGFEHATGDVVVTLPAYSQIDPQDVGRLLAALDTADVAIGHRTPRAGGWLEGLRRRAFHGLLGRVTGLTFRDLGCGARALRRRVVEAIDLYGDQHRFLAVMADRLGFRVREVDVRQSPRDRHVGVYGPRVYARSLLDIFTVFFLARFTKKPLRFFGMLGVTIFGLGALVVIWLVIERLAFGMPLADRPALLLGSLLVVLGVQLFALGLIGELIIFTHARQLKEYQVEEVVESRADVN
jgi:glycosyltransferase involved in cell wall biosynthesis